MQPRILSLLRLDFLLPPRRRPTFRNTGFYFKDGNDLYDVTPRHVLFFPADEDISDYTYNPGEPHKPSLVWLSGFDDD